MCGVSGDMVQQKWELWFSSKEIWVVKDFVYFGAVMHSSIQSDPDILQQSALTCVAIQSMDKHFWKSWISTSVKLKLYNVNVNHNFLTWLK